MGPGLAVLVFFILPLVLLTTLGLLSGFVAMGIVEIRARQVVRAGGTHSRPRWGAFLLRGVIWGALGWELALLVMRGAPGVDSWFWIASAAGTAAATGWILATMIALKPADKQPSWLRNVTIITTILALLFGFLVIEPLL